MLVHNTVVSDARVRKQAKTLTDNNFNVSLFGYGNPQNAPAKLDGVILTIVEKVPLPNPRAFLNKINQYFLELIVSLFMLIPIAAYLISIIVNISVLNSIFCILILATAFCTFLLFARNRFKLLAYGVPMSFIVMGYGIIFWQSLDTKPTFANFILTLLLIALVIFILFKCKRKITEFLRYQRGKRAVPLAFKMIAKRLATEVMKQPFDVIHCHDIIGLMAGVLIKKQNPQVKLIWDAHELYTQVSYKSAETAVFVDRVIKDSAKYVSIFTTINENFVEFYKTSYPALPDASIMMNATRKTNLSSKPSTKLRDATSLDAEQKILLFQGGLSPGRGIKQLLTAAENFPDDWTIVFMGSGPMQEEIFFTANNLNSNYNRKNPVIVNIPPAPYDELAEWTSGATVGIIPYENINMNHLYCTPNKLWEYPNAGIPILASGLIEMSAMIEKYDTGILMKKNFGPKDICSALKEFTPSTLKRFKKNCQTFNRIENWEKYEPTLINLYKQFG